MQYHQAESWGYYVPKRTSIISDPLEKVARLASGSAVVVFSISSCCMCHAVKRLFCGMGVNPTVYELDHDPRGKGDREGINEAAREFNFCAGCVHRREANWFHGPSHGFPYQWNSRAPTQGSWSALALISTG
ncbi:GLUTAREDOXIN-C5 [Salix viminalis]|uniref:GLUTAREDOXIN-C5 n=1 Tax=Salix viminalis TaxID=40686 RepID=A0A9Q0TLF2_SALVM|nr:GLUTAREDOXIN-C5 [Salix viminalis]